ncbi:MAG: tRNA (N6-isopentenyl adenosine(37)-C2)-methylthiotransferase MiaB [Clostridiaceae bacterium]|nr:tRNA (N6-isopentenyl adenosine(37)-C2)-methylthiotransferase MiaB [Clostridiaceae bacterium]
MSRVIVSKDELDRQREYCVLIGDLFRRVKVSSDRFPTYSIKTYGCQLNESDSEKMAGYFELMGLSENENTPDILLLNTCAIRENAEERLFGNLGHFKALKTENPRMIIIVCGCMMKQSSDLERLRKHFNFVDLVFGPQDIHTLPEMLYHRVSEGQKIVHVSDEDYLPDDDDLPVLRKRRFRALVPIMYGCNNFCTYCVVPYTRGRERSRDYRRIISQLEQLSEQGYEEVMLLGQNVNSYGKDLPGAPEFPELLNEIAINKWFSRIRFMTSHPKDVSDRLIDVMAKNSSVERHLHLPFQSGSNDVLKRMNRGYTRERFLDTALHYRNEIPEGTISTDIIVGFPGETEADFEMTLDLMRRVRFDSAFTFIYSKRPGTAAEKFTDEVAPGVISDRFSRLLHLQNNHSLLSNQSVIGNLEEILIEGISHTNKSVYTGRTSSNRLINFTIPEDSFPVDGSFQITPDNEAWLEGKKAMVRLIHAKTFSIEGRLESFL